MIYFLSPANKYIELDVPDQAKIQAKTHVKTSIASALRLFPSKLVKDEKMISMVAYSINSRFDKAKSDKGNDS